MARSTPPAGTLLGSAAWPHRQYHTGLTEELYAHPAGDNSNDGLTWGTAKQDILGAYDAISGTAGAVIHFYHATYVDAANTTRGLWVAGGNDPNYGSLPAGWRHAKTGVHLIGHGQEVHQFAKKPQALMLGGSGTDLLKPTVWLANVHGWTFENISVGYPAIAYKIGFTTTNLPTTDSDSSGHQWINCGTNLNIIAGNGPGIEIGFSYWLTFKECQLNGNTYRYPITACSINAGTTARFTIGTHPLVAGDVVSVTGVTPSGYNGEWQVTSVAATTFDANIGTSPGAGSVFGEADPIRHYRRAAIAHDGIDHYPGGYAAALIQIEDCIFGSGVHFQPGALNSSGDITMINNTVEGAFGNTGPPGLHIRGTYGAGDLTGALKNIIVINTEMADTGAAPGVLVEGISTRSSLVTAIGCLVTGNATVFNGGVLAASFDRRRIGIEGGTFLGHSAAAQRVFGVTPALGTNKAKHDTSTWTGAGGVTLTTGKAAPDGSTHAVRVLNTNAYAIGATVYGSAATATALGDLIIAGVWRRYVSGSSSSSNWPILSVNDGSIRFNNTSSNYFSLTQPNAIDDGAWDWQYAVGKVTTAPSVGSPDWSFQLTAGQNNEIDYAYPVLFNVPASAGVDEDEIWNIARYLRSWPDGADAVAGTTVMPFDSKLIFPPDTNLYRSAANVLATSDSFAQTGAGTYHEFLENGTTDAAAGAANTGRLYVRDNGAGKSQLVVRFNTGAVQVIASEP